MKARQCEIGKVSGKKGLEEEEELENRNILAVLSPDVEVKRKGAHVKYIRRRKSNVRFGKLFKLIRERKG